jgi:putative NADH-flavin reductase
MKIALIGGTGFVGTAALNEALQRGHQVTALARDPAKLAPRSGLTVVKADVTDAEQVAAAVKGHDAVINAFNPGWNAPDLYNAFLNGTRAIVGGIKRSGVKRVLIVGGAGSLYVAPGVQLVDTDGFKSHVPPNIIPGAQAARDALNEIRKETELDWSFLSPAAMLQPGERKGAFRIGADDLLTNGDQPGSISVQDLAVAIVDELEKPRHIRRRFTVAY